ncbi:unnamed protein product, partial [Rhizoctonia solani]
MGDTVVPSRGSWWLVTKVFQAFRLQFTRIGREIALKLASHGYSLALGNVSSNQQRLKQVADECTEIQKDSNLSHKPKTCYGPCDVSVELQVESLVERAVNELGGINVMVANAGIYGAVPLLETSDELFDRLYAVNV